MERVFRGQKNSILLNSYTDIGLRLSTALSVGFRFGALQMRIPIDLLKVTLHRSITCKFMVLMNGPLCPDTADF